MAMFFTSFEIMRKVPLDERQRIEEYALQVVKGLTSKETSRLVRYHRIAPANLEFVRIYRIKRVQTANVVWMNAWNMAPPSNALYVSVGLDSTTGTMIILYGEVKNGKPVASHYAAIGYANSEMKIAHKDVYNYLNYGWIPVPTQ
jgi:hypothetical protein